MTDGVVTKYYYAGSQRIAMRTNGSLFYLLGDHLGSTNLTTDANGTVVSEMRYKAWGETRYASGTTPTQYQYTGQYSDSYINLLWYNSRHYDPALGRFIQPDSIVPTTTQGVQAWDRFAYTNNNPVRYTDPTGHCISCFIVTAAFTAANLAMIYVPTALGARPDYEGIAATMILTNTKDAVVAAGLSVQSEYPWAIVGGGGRGWAQAKDEEIKDGQNPYSPSDAVAIMEKRINTVVDACTLCKGPTDNLIVAALAQNYPGFNNNTVTYLTVDPRTNRIDWMDVMTNRDFNNPQAPDAKIRQSITGMNYETRLMLKIYMQDLDILMGLGYQLPDKYAGADFKYINNLIYPRTGGRNIPR